MNIGEESEFFKANNIDTSRRFTDDAEYDRIQKLIRAENLRRTKEIKKYCNHHMYSDVHAYEVVGVISHQTIEVRQMKATKDPSWEMDWEAGGFAGHCSNQRSQKWFYESDPEAKVKRLRWSNANAQWQIGKHTRFVMSNHPYEFYDYNF